MEKLQNGDYCENLTKEQFEELGEIECLRTKLDYYESLNYMGYNGRLLSINFFKRINLLSFDDFKQRAINTFKK